MSVNSKHIATFLLGAAAGYAAFKYSNMSDEEKEKLMNDIKNKAKDLKTEAEGMIVFICSSILINSCHIKTGEVFVYQQVSNMHPVFSSPVKCIIKSYLVFNIKH